VKHGLGAERKNDLPPREHIFCFILKLLEEVDGCLVNEISKIKVNKIIFGNYS